MHRTLRSADIAVPPVPALTSGLVKGDWVYVTGQLAYEAEAGGIPAGLDAFKAAHEVLVKEGALSGEPARPAAE